MQSAFTAVLPAGALFAAPPPGSPAIGDPPGFPVWGRPLAVSRDAVVPFLGDLPATLDAQP